MHGQKNIKLKVCVCFRRNSPQWARAFPFTKFLDHTQRRTTVGRIPLGEWSARRRDLYLTTHNTHNRHTAMPLVGFEPTISAGERPQTYALDRVAAGTDIKITIIIIIIIITSCNYVYLLFLCVFVILCVYCCFTSDAELLARRQVFLIFPVYKRMLR